MDFKMRNGIADFEAINLERHGLFSFWVSRASFSRNSLSFLICFSFQFIINFHSFDKGKSTVAFSYMFWSNVNFFFDFSLFHLLVKDKAERSRIDIENFSSSSMIEVMGHSFMDGSVYNNVDEVSFFVSLQIIFHSNRSVSSEWLFELMSCS